jgi:SAM-dependent methyltransferase
MTDAATARTERFLLRAGLRPGMRVLDIGSGRGLVAVVLAELVGPSGEVVGVEREAKYVAMAGERSAELGLSNVRFVEAELSQAAELGSFDAAIGRRVLMYQPDPVAAVRDVANAVEPGGIVCFEEVDGSMQPASSAAMPLHHATRQWIWRTLEPDGTNLQMGFGLHGALAGAGLERVEVDAEMQVMTPGIADPTADIIRFLLPRIVERGVATEAEVDIDTLSERLAAERVDATFVGDFVFAAWGRVPAA